MSARQLPEAVKQHLPTTLPSYVADVLQSETFRRYRGKVGTGPQFSLGLIDMLDVWLNEKRNKSQAQKAAEAWRIDGAKLVTMLTSVRYQHNDPAQAMFLKKALCDSSIIWPGEELLDEEMMSITMVLLDPTTILPILKVLEKAEAKCTPWPHTLFRKDTLPINDHRYTFLDMIGIKNPKSHNEFTNGPCWAHYWRERLNSLGLGDNAGEIEKEGDRYFSPNQDILFGGSLYQPKRGVPHDKAEEERLSFKKLYCQIQDLGCKCLSKYNHMYEYQGFFMVGLDFMTIKKILGRKRSKHIATWTFKFPKKWVFRRKHLGDHHNVCIKMVTIEHGEELRKQDRRAVSTASSHGLMAVLTHIVESNDLEVNEEHVVTTLSGNFGPAQRGDTKK